MDPEWSVTTVPSAELSACNMVADVDIQHIRAASASSGPARWAPKLVEVHAGRSTELDMPGADWEAEHVAAEVAVMRGLRSLVGAASHLSSANSAWIAGATRTMLFTSGGGLLAAGMAQASGDAPGLDKVRSVAFSVYHNMKAPERMAQHFLPFAPGKRDHVPYDLHMPAQSHDVGAALRKPENADLELVLIPVVIAGATGWGENDSHANMLFVYPRLRVACLYDPHDGMSGGWMHMVRKCETMRYILHFLGMADFEAANFADTRLNKDGGTVDDVIQGETENELAQASVHQALLTDNGYCITWCRLAAYLCLATGIHQPRIVMGIAQSMFRADPALMVAGLVGCVLRAVSVQMELDPVTFAENVRYSRTNARAGTGRQGTTWTLTENTLRALGVSVSEASDEYARVDAFFRKHDH